MTSPGPTRRDGPALTDRAPRFAVGAFLIVVAAAVPLYVIGAREQWFSQDEWDFLAARDGGSWDDLMRPHNEHWSILPIIAYRILWRLVGLRSYVVYQSMTIGLHLIAGVLLRNLMRRSGVGPWIATAAASAFVLFGSGYQNIVWGFQIGFVGSLVFGLAQLLLSDHDGPFDRRDGAGVLCGLAALMCSGVGVPMVVIVGLAQVLRGRWWPGFLHTVPLAGVYLLWWWTFSRDAHTQPDVSPVDVLQFVRTGIQNAFGTLGQVPGVGALLAGVVIAGLALAVGQRTVGRGRVGLRRSAALPLALLIGLVIFYTISGFGRSGQYGPEFARRSRYAYLAAALLLPAVALAAETLVRRWRSLAIPAVAVLLIGVPGNVGAIDVWNTGDDPNLILALAQVPAAAGAPRRLRPLQRTPERVGPEKRVVGDSPRITMGWLQDGLTSGRIPTMSPLPPSAALDATILIALSVDETAQAVGQCDPLKATVTRRLGAGDSIGFRGVLLATARLPGGPRSPAFGLARERPSRLVTSHGPLIVEVKPYPGVRAELCA